MKSIMAKLVIAGILSLATFVNCGYIPAIGVKSVYYSGATHCTAASLQSWNCGEAC